MGLRLNRLVGFVFLFFESGSIGLSFVCWGGDW